MINSKLTNLLKKIIHLSDNSELDKKNRKRLITNAFPDSAITINTLNGEKARQYAILKIHETKQRYIGFFYPSNSKKLALLVKPKNLSIKYSKKLGLSEPGLLKEIMKEPKIPFGSTNVLKVYNLSKKTIWQNIITDLNILDTEIYPKLVLKSNTKVVHKLDLVKTSQLILKSLISKRSEDPKLRFRLREENTRRRFNKGYWFPGNENSIILSFWSGDDTIGKPNIFFEIRGDATFRLILSSEDSAQKTVFLEQLSKIVPHCRRAKGKGKIINVWSKFYFLPKSNKETNQRIIEILNEFLLYDKERIDLFLDVNLKAKTEYLGDIKFLGERMFESQLNKVLSSRNSLKGVKGLGLDEEKFAPLRLEFIKLENIGHFENLYIDQLNHQVVCFIGDNGIGKSTILRAISLGLIGVDETPFLDTQNTKIQRLLRIRQEKQTKIIHYEKGLIQVGYQFGKICKNSINLSFGGLKGIKLFDDPNSDFLLSESEDYLKQLVLGFPQSQGNFDRLYNSVSRETDAALNPNVGDLLPLIYDSQDDRLERFSEWLIKTYSKALQQSERSWKITRTGRVIQKVFKLISELTETKIEFKTIDLDESNIWIKTPEAPKGILLDLISQGFRKVFGWIGYFIMRLSESNSNSKDFTKEASLVIIDEIATYLHPKWQMKILRVLVDNFPNTQFIISTHSPMILSSLKEEEVIIYSIEKVEKSITAVLQDYNAYGADVNYILNRFMNTLERPKNIKEKFNKLFKYIQEGKLKKAKGIFQELKDEIDSSDPDLQKGSLLIETHELIKK